MTSTVDAAIRTRTHEWADPAAVLPHAAALSGREALIAMGAGELPYPPIASTMDFESFELTPEGEVVVTITAQEFHYNPIGMVHGGVMATLLDTVCGCAVHATLPAGVLYTSLDLSVKFIRPMTTQSGRVQARGRVVHRGSRMALAEGTIVDENGKLLATASSSCLIFAG